MQQPVVIIPLFNHARTVQSVLDGVRAAGLTPIVVDDGSTDGGDAEVQAWMNQHRHHGTLVRLPSNQGKARAILAGFKAAIEMGASHALTMDADGQHDPAAITAFLRALSEGSSPDLLVLGNRQPLPADYPLTRLVGRMLSGLGIRAACGLAVHDAACGMRLYPLAVMQRVHCVSGRYAWEEEAVIRVAWRRAAVAEVQIPTIYRDPAVAPSHYRFVRDWCEGTLVLVSCVVFRALWPLTPWHSASTPRRALAWPLAWSHGICGLYDQLMATFGLGVAAACAATIAALGPPMLVAWMLGALLAWTAVRTRCPVLPLAAGWLAGFSWPIAGLACAFVLAPVTCVLLLARLRQPGVRCGPAPAGSHAAAPETPGWTPRDGQRSADLPEA